MKKLLIILFFCLSLIPSFKGQEINDPSFNHLEPEQLGLKSIGWITWDSQGRIWGTYDDGFFSYNGYAIKKQPHIDGDSSTALEKKAQAVFLDSKDNLWLAYPGSSVISRYNTKTGQMKHFFPDSTRAGSIPFGPLTNFKEDSRGNIWILTWGHGFSIMDPVTGKCKNYLPHAVAHDKRDEFRNRVKDMFERPDGKVVLAYFTNENDGYLPDLFDPRTGTFEPLPIAQCISGLNEQERKFISYSLRISNFVFVDQAQNYWFGTYSGLIFLDTKNKTAQRVTGQKEMEKLGNLENARGYVYDSNNDYLWVATPNSGVMLVNRQTRQVKYVTHNVKINNSLSDNRIRYIRKDRDGNIWISTGIGTYSIYTPILQQFSLASWGDMDLQYVDRSLQRIPVNQMLIKHNGLVYVSSANGISVYDPVKKQLVKKIDPASTLNRHNKYDDNNPGIVQQMKFLGEDRLLITSPYHPAIYDEKTGRFSRPAEADSVKKLGFDLLFRHSSANQNPAYLSNPWGAFIYEYNTESNVVKPYFRLSTEKFITSIYSYVLKSGKWLLSNGEKEFCIFDPASKNYRMYGALHKDAYFPDSTIKAAYVDNDGLVWFGTESGLYRFDEQSGKAENMSAALGIQKETVNSLVHAADGSWWVALDKHIIKWDPVRKQSFRFGRETGLNVGSFISSVAQTDDAGKIYIASINGILMFDPARINIPSTIPQLHLSALTIKEDTLSPARLKAFSSGPADLKWSENFLSFEFATSQVYAPAPHRFYYRLQGIDSAWQDNGISNRIRYTNLSHGSYVLEVKARNTYGIESPVLRLPFTIKTPVWLTWWFYVILVAATVLGAYYLIKRRERAYIHRQQVLEERIRERTAEVVAKAEEINHQKDIIQEKNRELTDSIYYAQRIQQSILPDAGQVEKGLSQHFIFFMPKDIVSGDFYWYAKHKHITLWAVVDCTGHGVPGGFMSMLGSGLLNQIVNEELKLQPDEILNSLRNRVIMALKQTGAYGENKDGMDISVCAYNTETQVLQFAGANNPAYIVRQQELIELKADKQPIGIYVGEVKKFTLHELQLQKNDCIFMSSDGYADQFGGPKGKKFKTANLEKLFLEVAPLPVNLQKQKLEAEFVQWKSHFEQLDDVCVFGVKI